MSRTRKPQRTARLAAGQEQYRVFQGHGNTLVQYEYGLPDGSLFTCVEKTLAKARQRRDAVLQLLEKTP